MGETEKTTQDVTVKNMPVETWNKARSECKRLNVNMNVWLSKAIEHWVGRGDQELIPPFRAKTMELPEPLGTVTPGVIPNTDLAELMQGTAALYSASQKPVPRHVRGHFSAVVESRLRAERGMEPLPPRQVGKRKDEDPEVMTLTHEE